MGSEIQPKDEREISINLEIGTGAFMPGGKIALGFKRVWQKRANRLLGSVAASASVREDDVIEAVASGNGFNDVFAEGLDIITRSGDEFYGDTFARFIAAALKDTAKIDICMFLMDKFAKLRPPHIKVFWFICEEAFRVGGTGEARIAHPEPAQSYGNITREAVSDRAGLPIELISSILKEIEEAELTTKNRMSTYISLRPTEVGKLAYEIVRAPGPFPWVRSEGSGRL